jgi:preprotein translocase subunit SecG
MNIWFNILIVVHILVCLLLILLVLIQNDKGGGLAGAFGGMGSNAAFSGSSAANFITTITTWVAVGLFAVIIGLNVISGKLSHATQADSELKSAQKGLSSGLPTSAMPLPAPGAGGVIPGLETGAEKK